ncbi:MAG: UPF0182 family protein [Bacteroidota bacterium]
MNKILPRILFLILLPVILFTVTSSYLFEWLWLSELGYSRLFWTVRGAQITLTLVAFIVSALYLVLNLRRLSGELKNVNFQGTPLQNFNLNLALERHQKQLTLFFTILGLGIAFLFAVGFYISWDDSLRFIWNVPYGETDPVYGKDIGFYLFQLPFWKLIQVSLTLLSGITLVTLVLIYLFTGLLDSGPEGFRASDRITSHIRLNGALFTALLAWGFWLARYQLLLKPDGIVFGAGYTDMTIQYPTLLILVAGTALLSLLLVLPLRVPLRRWVPLITIGLVIVLAAGRVILPQMVQSFRVNPNELELESTYLSNNIEMTRLAFGLDQVQEIDYSARDTLRADDVRRNRDAIDNIRLWDPRLLIQTYRQLQEIRSYYEFYQVDNDRYTIDDETVQVMLSAREIAHTLPSQSDTWVNRHLQYTHGFGLVMNSVTEANQQGQPQFLLQDIPPVATSPDLQVEQPAIYYGESNEGYYIVNSEVPELHYPSGDENAYIHYDGTGGIEIQNFFRKLLFAWELGDINILLSEYIQDDSRLQIYRSVQERIRRITPFLTLDSDPYLVMNEGRLYWIQDAYTTSRHFPYAQPKRGVNYIRNSVKVVVDAYHGDVTYYKMGIDDPILDVYDSIFPNLFRPLSELPEGMEDNFRYPQELFEIQLETYNRYHMVAPQIFYNQEDLWTRPNETYAGREQLMEPYYVLARLPGEEELEFLLISPATPENRDNMIGWMAAKSDPESYGELLVYRLPKDRLIYGPSQIEARIDQDPEISRQIALWDQRGSSVIRGNLMVIPLENAFLYVEPVFLIAESNNIPQLQRVIVSVGESISMQPTIEAAILDIFGQQAELNDFLPGAAPAVSPVTGEPTGIDPDLVNRQREVREQWQEVQRALESGQWVDLGEALQALGEEIEKLETP